MIFIDVISNILKLDNNSSSAKFNTIASLSSSNNSQSIANNLKSSSKPVPELDAHSISHTDLFNESFSNSICSNIKRGASLYIICERSQMKYLKASDLNKGNFK